MLQMPSFVTAGVAALTTSLGVWQEIRAERESRKNARPRHDRKGNPL